MTVATMRAEGDILAEMAGERWRSMVYPYLRFVKDADKESKTLSRDETLTIATDYRTFILPEYPDAEVLICSTCQQWKVACTASVISAFSPAANPNHPDRRQYASQCKADNRLSKRNLDESRRSGKPTVGRGQRRITTGELSALARSSAPAETAATNGVVTGLTCPVCLASRIVREPFKNTHALRMHLIRAHHMDAEQANSTIGFPSPEPATAPPQLTIPVLEPTPTQERPTDTIADQIQELYAELAILQSSVADRRSGYLPQPPARFIVVNRATEVNSKRTGELKVNPANTMYTFQTITDQGMADEIEIAFPVAEPQNGVGGQLIYTPVRFTATGLDAERLQIYTDALSGIDEAEETIAILRSLSGQLEEAQQVIAHQKTDIDRLNGLVAALRNELLGIRTRMNAVLQSTRLTEDG